MPSPHLLRANGSDAAYSSGLFGVSRSVAAELAHLLYMDTTMTPSTDPGNPPLQLIEQCLSPSELCAHLQVSVQTLYDLRSQGCDFRCWMAVFCGCCVSYVMGFEAPRL